MLRKVLRWLHPAPGPRSVLSRVYGFFAGMVAMPLLMGIASFLPAESDHFVMLTLLPAIALALVIPGRTRWFGVGALIAFVGVVGYMWSIAAQEVG